VKETLKTLLDDKEQDCSQVAIRNLETIDVDLMSFHARPFCFAKVWYVEIHDLDVQHLGPEEIGYWPLFDVLIYHDKAIILYSSQLTFLDGYDQFSDEVKVHIVTDNMLRDTRNSLFRPQFTKQKVIKEKRII
jgi:hypothetical protein